MGLFNKNTAHDILQEKEKKVSELAQQATDAVDLVTRTISSLELVNQEIDDAVAEIDAYSERLSGVRDAMNRNRSSNAAIIANFSKLLNVE